MKRLVPVVKLLAVVIVGLFVVKLVSGWANSKFNNKVTNAVNNVIQAA